MQKASIYYKMKKVIQRGNYLREKHYVRQPIYIGKRGGEGKNCKKSKTNPSIIQTYLQKSYDEKVLKIITKEIESLDKFLEKSESSVENVRQIYSSNPEEIKSYINPIDCSTEDYIKKWLSIPYEGKKILGNLPTYVTDKGEQVRSKSELNIANALYKNGIPYKYECPLSLKNGIVIYPDFTVLDVMGRKVIYWEHRGMMDDREYAKHAVSRVKEYNKNGICIGDNLIITEETSTNPLETSEIYSVIKHVLMK